MCEKIKPGVSIPIQAGRITLVFSTFLLSFLGNLGSLLSTKCTEPGR